MPEPLVVTISHRLGKEEAKRRLDRGLDHVRAQLAAHVKDLEFRWEGDRLDFRVSALGQTVTGRADVEEDAVRVEIGLPWMLRMLAGSILPKIRQETTFLLEKPPKG